MRRALRQRVLAAAEADFDPALQTGRERRGGIAGRDAQPRQRLSQQSLLPRAQAMAAAAAVQALGRRFALEAGVAQNPKAERSAGTRSVRSQVNVPRSGSGSRPKWPYAEVGA